MIIYYSQEELLKFIQAEIRAWESIGGGPNINAFEFDPKSTDPKTLHELGYYSNPDSWIAGARIKALNELMTQVRNAATPIKK
jgi:hypothetical protein